VDGKFFVLFYNLLIILVIKSKIFFKKTIWKKILGNFLRIKRNALLTLLPFQKRGIFYE